MEISVVLPTRDRAAALRETFGELLRLERVAEVVVVDDASTDETPELLAAVCDARVRTLRRATSRGCSAAKNLGAAAARGDWILFAEDDCRFPPDFARVLLEEALSHGADVVSAPMLHPPSEDELEAAVAAARRGARTRASLDEVAPYPPEPVATPLLQAPSLVARRVLERVRFDEAFGLVGYREETDFYLRATYAGFACLLTPRTFFWEPRRWAGGCERPPLARELAHVRNNWRFLRRHGAWLAERGYIRSPLREQAGFVGRRLRALAG